MTVTNSYRLLAYQAQRQASSATPVAGASAPVAAYQPDTASFSVSSAMTGNQVQTDLNVISQQLALVQQQALAAIAAVPAPAPAPANPVQSAPPDQTQSAIAALKAQLDALQKQAQSLVDQLKTSTQAPTPPQPAPKSDPKPAPPPPAPPPPPKPITDRGKIYLHQPNGWTCGPTSLTMAAAAFGVRPANDNTVNELVALTHTNPQDGVPDRNQIPDAAKKIGLQSTPSEDASPAKVRDALKAGHGVILNGSLGTGGHFIYVAGLNPDGSFIICDPWRSNITSWNDAQLNQFATCVPGHNQMVEIWK